MKNLQLETLNGTLVLKSLSPQFYLKDPVTIARALLGKIFVKFIDGKILAGKIVETEAYGGANDEAAHSFTGKTPRNAMMFEKGGVLYVYFIYGNYYCLNVVTGKVNDGTAVLIRAMEPVAGIDFFAEKRFGRKEISRKEFLNLLNGPGKICRAFDIDKKENGLSLFDGKISIYSPGEKNFEIQASSRIGIKKGLDKLWRFYLKNSPYVSKK